MNKKKLGQLILGPVIFIMCCLFLPHSIFTTLASRAAIGTVLWVSLWWILRPVDLAVAALLPIAVNVFIEIAPMEKVISNFASETILLVAGASILGVTMEVTGLGNRIAHNHSVRYNIKYSNCRCNNTYCDIYSRGIKYESDSLDIYCYNRS